MLSRKSKEFQIRTAQTLYYTAGYKMDLDIRLLNILPWKFTKEL